MAAGKSNDRSLGIRFRFGAGVRARRGELGLTQEELAFRAGLHPTYVSGVERGLRNVSLVNIGGLATALSLKPSELMERCGM